MLPSLRRLLAQPADHSTDAHNGVWLTRFVTFHAPDSRASDCAGFARAFI